MTSLVMMYVYFDKHGDIKAITPTLDDGIDATYALFPLEEVNPMLTGKANPTNFKIQRLERLDGVKYKLVQKISSSNIKRKIRMLDNFLTKVPDTKLPGDPDSSIIITNYLIDKIITVQLASFVKEMYHSGTEDQRELVEEFMNRGHSNVYITRKDVSFPH